MSVGFQAGSQSRHRIHQLSWFSVLSGWALLAACSSPSAPEKTPAAAGPATAPAAPAATAAKPEKAGLQTYYAGTLGNKLAVHLCLLPVDTAVYGDYYYGTHGAGLALLGQRLPTGQLRLREFASKAHPDRPTAEFLLVPAPDGSLAGTWRTLPPARPRQLAVALRAYTPPPVAGCRVRVANADSGEPTITVPDAAITQLLRVQLRRLVAEDGGDPGTQMLTAEYADNCLLSIMLHSEMVGASVTPGVSHSVFDLRTGEGLAIENEIDPRQVPALVAEANRRLQAQLRRYIDENKAETGDGGVLMEEDVAGLRAQQYTRATFEAYNGSYLLDDSVRLAFPVQYEAMNSFVSKMYTDAFAAAFSFAEIQPYLRPDSPLRRLAPAVGR
ncbi:hypothetical protein MON38_10430 [Hymenobacter sp. DH14]|uniref:DUF3298 domain-containing protein n=1 Tax=Hymenobacter cyanobacteriorum TaxID=2926463 RepID=A0A9X2AF27_9BACT|nr:hypothetical protein [Hymenobacter cyanobacteriorum]MCI1187836.1 hypothetical protein [Hymenobacter cyanobacteriorum]